MRVIETELPAIWFHSHLSKPVTRIQNNGTEMGDHKQSNSWISKFTNFQNSLHRRHILLQHKQNTYQVTTFTLIQHKQNTYPISRPIRCTMIFSLEEFGKNNDELLHTKISNHNIFYSS